MPPDPPPPPPALESCAFGARLGNRSVFVLDPRLWSTLRETLTVKTLDCASRE